MFLWAQLNYLMSIAIKQCNCIAFLNFCIYNQISHIPYMLRVFGSESSGYYWVLKF